MAELCHSQGGDCHWQRLVRPLPLVLIVPCLISCRSVGRDPSVFPNPENFDPQRWLNSEGRIRDDLKAYTFGFGRRVCPGQYMAHA